MCILINADLNMPSSCMVCQLSKAGQFNTLLCHALDDMDVTNCSYERHERCPLIEVEEGDTTPVVCAPFYKK